MKKIPISCAGDERFKQKLQLLSLRTGKQIGDLVREAIDAKYGVQMDDLDASFFASSSADTHIVNTRERTEI